MRQFSNIAPYKREPLEKGKIHAKVAADQRGRAGSQLKVYTMSDLEQKMDAVTRLGSAVIN
jgi:hypothetical protein